MRNFQDTFEPRKRSFISAFSICMGVPLIKVNHLIYCILINFNISLRINCCDIFHYFCEDKTAKTKRLNQYIKSRHFISVTTGAN